MLEKKINLILSVEAVAHPLTGIGRYTYELAKGLIDHPSVTEVRLLRRIWWMDPSALRTLVCNEKSGPAITASSKGRGIESLRSYGRCVTSSLRSMRCLPYKHHIFHSPNYALPAFSGRSVSTIHDISVFRHPEYHPSERVAHMHRIFPSILRRGDLFLTVSEFSRQEILNYFNIGEDRVMVVQLGVDARYRPMSPADSSLVLQKFGLLPQCYTLSVSTIEPRKNIERLMQAYRHLPAALRNAYPLVLAGNEGWNSDAIHQEILVGQAEGWLIYLSYVAESDLPALYAGARVFGFVSLYEGFGLPVLEAMSTGVPVVCSGVASLPEVGGEAVRYVDPLQPEDIRQALIDLLENEGLNDFYRRAGLARARQFSWSRMVNDTVAAYQRLY